MYRQVFDDLPCATLVLDSASAVVAHNAAARELFGDAAGPRGPALLRPRRLRPGQLRAPARASLPDGGGARARPAAARPGLHVRRPADGDRGRRAAPAASARSSRCGRSAAAEAASAPAAPPLRITTLGGLRLDARRARPRRRLAAPPAGPAAALPDLRARSPRARRRAGRGAVAELRARRRDQPAPGRPPAARAARARPAAPRAVALHTGARGRVLAGHDRGGGRRRRVRDGGQRRAADQRALEPVGGRAAAQPRRRALHGRVPGRRALRRLGARGARAAARAGRPRAAQARRPAPRRRPAPARQRGAAAPRRAGAARPGRAARPDRADAAPRPPRRGRPALRPRPPPLPAGVRAGARLLAARAGPARPATGAMAAGRQAASAASSRSIRTSPT